MARLIGFLRDRSHVVKWVFFASLLFFVVFDFYADRHEPHFFGDTIIGFWSIFGLIACLGMIVICKGISHVWLTKDEDYYDK